MPTLVGDFADMDGNKRPDYNAAYKVGFRAFICRAMYGRGTDGKPYIDKTARNNVQAIIDAGMKFGAYGFLCPQLAPSDTKTPPPEIQIGAFHDEVKEFLRPGADFVPFIDVEQAAPMMPATHYLDWVTRAFATAEELFGCDAGIYTSARVWAEDLHNLPAPELRWCTTWIAKPWPLPVRSVVDLTGNPNQTPIMPRPQAPWGNRWNLYQYQGDALRTPGFPGTIDVSRPAVIGQGAKGESAAYVQYRLVKHGHDVAIDGDFGPKTKDAVQTFQLEHKLTADGLVGLDTGIPLSWPPQPPHCRP